MPRSSPQDNPQEQIFLFDLSPDPDSGAPWKDLRGLNPLLAMSSSSDSWVDCLVESVGCTITRSGVLPPN